MYFGLSDLIVSVCTIIFTDLKKKLVAARREEKKQPRPSGKFYLKYLMNRGTILLSKVNIRLAFVVVRFLSLKV